MTHQVSVRELIAWGVDESAYRPSLDRRKVERALHAIGTRVPAISRDATLQSVPADAERLIDQQRHRRDLQAEMDGLVWRTGFVDLRCTFAFQRRLVFDSKVVQQSIPEPGDWPALIALTFPPPVPAMQVMTRSTSLDYVLQSGNPNLQLRPSARASAYPFELYTGSPFLEVAEYQGRWFLRDGYHRAYRLLQAQVAHVPAVIVQARSLAELGAEQPWFFPETTILSTNAPRVVDFLDDDLTFEYTRPRLLKTLRVRIEESVEPALDPYLSGVNR